MQDCATPSTTERSLEDDKVRSVLQDLAPFLKWLHDSSRLQEAEIGIGFFHATGMSTGLMPRNDRGPEMCLRFFVKKKLPPTELNNDWDLIWRAFTEYGPKLRFGSMTWDKREIRIPKSLMGYPTDVVETEPYQTPPNTTLPNLTQPNQTMIDLTKHYPTQPNNTSHRQTTP